MANEAYAKMEEEVDLSEAQKLLPPGAAGSLLAGAVSGGAQAFLTTPHDYLKIQAQLRGGSLQLIDCHACFVYVLAPVRSAELLFCCCSIVCSWIVRNRMDVSAASPTCMIEP